MPHAQGVPDLMQNGADIEASRFLNLHPLRRHEWNHPDVRIAALSHIVLDKDSRGFVAELVPFRTCGSALFQADVFELQTGYRVLKP
mmetsp:Transcript_57159/g.99971  ORF Transcript_57159/g.99971 Transcript_57159/m.99971 type:complete len:87 (+) Transcript_57159:828-1088(+)